MAFPNIAVRIAFASDAFAGTPTWTDVSADVMEIPIIRRGRMHELDRVEAGEAVVILKNTSGNYWPNNTGGAYYNNVKPLKRINILMTYNFLPYHLFTGYIEKWNHRFLHPQAGGTAVVILQCADVFKHLAKTKLTNAGYAQQRSDQRIGEILDDISWPAANRALDTGRSTMKATGALTGLGALEHLYLIEQTELGAIYVNGVGAVVFRERYARIIGSYLTSSGTFGEDGAELKYHTIEFADDDEYLLNDIHITRDAGAEQIASDASSQTSYGNRSFQRTGLLMIADTEAADQAYYLLSQYKDPSLRVKAIVIAPDRDPDNLYPQILGREIGQRITVRNNNASIDEAFYIEGIEHVIPRGIAGWMTRWTLSRAAVVAQYWSLGVAGLSELGTTTRLAY